jgi:hypothetical protein
MLQKLNVLLGSLADRSLGLSVICSLSLKLPVGES